MSSGALIETDQESVPTLDLMLVDARAEVDLDTVSLMLNGNQIIGFARRGKTPTGLRLVVDRESVRHPHLALAEDNHLQFAAADMEGNRYRGEFDLRISDDVAGIRLVAAGVLSQPVLQEVAKPNASAPTIKLLADPEVVPDGNSWQLVCGSARRQRNPSGGRAGELEGIRARSTEERISISATAGTPQGGLAR